MQVRSFVPTVAFLAIVGVSLSQAYAQVGYRYADPAGFDTLSSPSTRTFNFRGPGDVAITSSGFSVAASGISTDATSRTYSGASPYDNPPWIAGNRPLFYVSFDDTGGTTPGSTINLEISFSQPLPAGSYLVFGDFDFTERLRIKAYADDAKTQLIPFSSFSFARQNGLDTAGSAADVTWTNFDVAYSGQLASNAQESLADPVATLVASTPIKRLIYEVTMDPAGNVGNNSIRFNFADPLPAVQAVPTLSQWTQYAMILALLLAGGRYARRRNFDR